MSSHIESLLLASIQALEGFQYVSGEDKDVGANVRLR